MYFNKIDSVLFISYFLISHVVKIVNKNIECKFEIRWQYQKLPRFDLLIQNERPNPIMHYFNQGEKFHVEWISDQQVLYLK